MKYLVTLFIACFAFIIFTFAQTDSLKQYTGKYTFPEGSPVADVEVVMKDTVLEMISSAGTSPLRLEKGDEFTIVSFSGTAIFKRGADKKITGIYIEAMGVTLEGNKEKEVPKDKNRAAQEPPAMIKMLLPASVMLYEAEADVAQFR